MSAPGAPLYTGAYGFDELDEPEQGRPSQCSPVIDPATAAAAAVPSSSPEASLPSGPLPMLFIKSDRLAQLSAQMPVNADRSALVCGREGHMAAGGAAAVGSRQHVFAHCSLLQSLQVHSLVEAYGLLEVRCRAAQLACNTLPCSVPRMQNGADARPTPPPAGRGGGGGGAGLAAAAAGVPQQALPAGPGGLGAAVRKAAG